MGKLCRSAESAPDFDEGVFGEIDLGGGRGMSSGVREERDCFAIPCWDCIHEVTWPGAAECDCILRLFSHSWQVGIDLGHFH